MTPGFVGDIVNLSLSNAGRAFTVIFDPVSYALEAHVAKSLEDPMHVVEKALVVGISVVTCRAHFRESAIIGACVPPIYGACLDAVIELTMTGLQLRGLSSGEAAPEKPSAGAETIRRGLGCARGVS